MRRAHKLTGRHPLGTVRHRAAQDQHHKINRSALHQNRRALTDRIHLKDAE